MAGALTPIGALSYNGARWRVTNSTAGSPSVMTIDYPHPFQVGDLITLSGMFKRVVDADVTLIQPKNGEWRVSAVPSATQLTVVVESVGGAPLLGWLTYPGWLPALGQRLEAGLYPALRRRLMNQFGAGDASSYVLPNLAGHTFCVGLDTEQVRVRASVFSQVMSGATARGVTGGESTHATVAAELPPHVHYANAAADMLRLPTRPVADLGSGYDGAGLAPASGYMGRVVAEYGDQIWLDQGYTSGTYTPSGNIVSGEPHENRPPAHEMFPLIYAGPFQ